MDIAATSIAESQEPASTANVVRNVPRARTGYFVAGRGTPVVMLHSSLGSKGQWSALAEQMSSPVGRMQSASASEALMDLLGPRERKALAAVLAPSRLFRSGQVLAHMPYVFVR